MGAAVSIKWGSRIFGHWHTPSNGEERAKEPVHRCDGDRVHIVDSSYAVQKVTESVVATFFLRHKIVSYENWTKIITDYEPQFESKFSAALWVFVGTKLVPTIKFYPHSNRQVDWVNKTLMERLRHCINKHRTDWDVLVPSITNSYNTQVHRMTQTSSFILMLGREPSGAVTYEATAAEYVCQLCQMQAKLKVVANWFCEPLRRDKMAYIERKSYAHRLNSCESQFPVFRHGVHIYMDKPPTRTELENDMGAKDSSRKLVPRIHLGIWRQGTKISMEKIVFATTWWL